MPSLFQLISKNSSDAIAITGKGFRLSYGQLVSAVDKGARSLAALGVTPGTPVGIMWRSSPATIVASLAAMVHGCAYVPLNPGDSHNRQDSTVHEAGIGAIAERGKGFSEPVFEMTNVGSSDISYGPGCLTIPERGEGLFIDEASLIVRSRILSDCATLAPEDVFAEEFVPVYDDPGTAIFAPLLLGATLVMVAPDAVECADEMDECGVTVLRATPTTISALISGEEFRALSHLRLVLMGGETIYEEFAPLVAKRLPRCRVLQYYAPRCAGREVAVHEIIAGDHGGETRAGRPLASTIIKVLDQQKRPAGVGMAGEIWIAGAGMPVSVYKNAHPPIEDGGLRKTGDIGRWLRNGELELIEDQRSIRTRRNRVWLADMSAAVRNVDVPDCLVVGVSGANLTRPVAYICAEPTELENLRERIAFQVPIHLRPSHLVAVSHIPFGSDGQPDIASLLALEIADKEFFKACLEEAIVSGGGAEAAVALSPFREERSDIEFSRFATALPRSRADCADSLPELDDSPRLSRVGTKAGSSILSIRSGGPAPLNVPKSLVEALYLAGSEAPSHGITYVRQGRVDEFQCYPDLLAEALCVAAGLRKAGLQAGNVVMLQLPDCHDFIAAFWGCVLNGCIVAPLSVASTYTKSNATVQKFRNAWQMLSRPVVLTDTNLVKPVQSLERELDMEGLRVIDLDDLRHNDPLANAAQSHAEDPCLILLTSGSTGVPKGVVLRHRNVLSRSAATSAMNGFSENEVSLNWLPLDHVGGIVMFHVRDVFLKCQQIHATTEAFLENPLIWLDWIERYRASITWAPNFAFALVNGHVEKIDAGCWNLQSMRFILNAGESIVPATARQFMLLLAKHGLPESAMHPAWGMSETSSAVTYSSHFSARESSTSPYVEVGDPIPGIEIRIVSPDGAVLPEGETGRLQIRGATVFDGYYNNLDANAEAFVDGWFYTGDLALMRDGALTITAREKDSIIINGVNYLSHEIEVALDGVEGIEPAYIAACAVRTPESQTDELAVFFVASEKMALDAAIEGIRDRITKSLGLNPAFMVALAKDQIPRTAIGKIQRSELQKRFTRGDFEGLITRSGPQLGPDSVPHWFYERKWKRRDLASPLTGVLPKHLLLVSAPGTLADELEGQLERVGVRCTLKTPQDGPAANLTEFDAIAFVWNGGRVAKPTDASGVRDIQSENLFPLVDLIGRVSGDSDASELRVFVITSEAQPIHERAIPSASTLRGYLASIAQDSGIRCCWIDFAGSAESDCAVSFVDELRNEQHEREIVWREGARFVPRLLPLDVEKFADANIRTLPEGFVLMTGGLGGIGVHIARMLLRSNRTRLLIIGRRSVVDNDGERGHVLRELQSMGTCEYRAIDVGEAAAIESIVVEFEQRWSAPLAGIIHLAGEGSLAAYWNGEAQVAAHDFERMFRSKVYGTVTLGRIAELRPKCALFAFSSVNGLFGGAQFEAYSAANSFVADFCEYQYARGYPACCFTWSTWDDTGMSRGTPQLALDVLRANGYQILSSKQGLESFVIGTALQVPHIIIGIDGSNAKIRPVIAGVSCRASRTTAWVRNPQPSSNPTPVLEVKDSFGRNIRVVVKTIEEFPRTAEGEIDIAALTSPIRRGKLVQVWRTEIERKIAEIWKDVLHIGDFSPEDNFFQLGGHSLIAAQATSRIRDAFGIGLSLRSLLEVPTVPALAAVVEDALGRGESSHWDHIPIADRSISLPPSFAQQRMWFLSRLNERSGFYNIAGAFTLSGNLDSEALEHSLNDIIQRHEVLRTVFPAADGLPLQRILPQLPSVLETEDLRSFPSGEREALLARCLDDYGEKPFDLENGPLVRALLLRFGDEEHVLIWGVHHIVFDGWSVPVFLRELGELYERYTGRAAAPLPPLPVQYVDYSVWQRQWLESSEGQAQLAYWRGHLSGLETLILPTDFPRPVAQSFRGARQRIDLGENLTAALRAFADSRQVTLYMVLLTAFKILLAYYSGQRSIVVGTPMAGRDRTEVESLIGLFVNTLIMCTDLGENPTVLDALHAIQESCVGAYGNAGLPLEKLVDELSPERDLSRNPLFQVMFGFGNQMPGAASARLPGLNIDQIPIDNRTAKLDLSLLLEEHETVQGDFEYCTDLFRPETVARMARHYRRVLEWMIAHAENPVSELDLMEPDERRQTLEEWNRTAADYGAPVCLHEWIVAQAEETPDAIAVQSVEEQISYRELMRRSGALAAKLRRMGVSADVSVGICSEHSIETIVGLLGILRAGGAYVPLATEYPEERLRWMVEDAGIGIVLTHRMFEEQLQGLGVEMVRLEDSENEQPIASPNWPVDPDNAAYILYTSGSTGRPKGVVMPHRGIVNYLQWCVREYGMNESTGAPLHSPLTFDLTMTSLFGPLVCGRTVTLIPGSDSVSGLNSALQGGAVFSLVKMTPAHLDMLIWHPDKRKSRRAARVLVVGGEALAGDTVAAWKREAPMTRIINEYGPTETAVGCCIYEAQAGEDYRSGVPIGRPIANMRLYILDRRLEPCPVGVPGELYIGGEGVARGYMRRPGLTAKHFIPDPYGKPGERLYRSGDVARYRSDGIIEFLGRADSQVKVRGFRVELGEIEEALRSHPAIRDAVVLPWGTSIDRRLAAYIVHDGIAVDKGVVSAYLKSKLPAYMVPVAFVFIDAIPINRNGKIDRTALPDVETAFTPEAIVPPIDELETQLVEIWSEVLGVTTISRDDNFFDIGGDSLRAARAQALILAKLGQELSILDLFQDPTIASLAERIRQGSDVAQVPAGEDRGENLQEGREVLAMLARQRTV